MNIEMRLKSIEFESDCAMCLYVDCGPTSRFSNAKSSNTKSEHIHPIHFEIEVDELKVWHRKQTHKM